MGLVTSRDPVQISRSPIISQENLKLESSNYLSLYRQVISSVC